MVQEYPMDSQCTFQNPVILWRQIPSKKHLLTAYISVCRHKNFTQPCVGREEEQLRKHLPFFKELYLLWDQSDSAWRHQLGLEAKLHIP